MCLVCTAGKLKILKTTNLYYSNQILKKSLFFLQDFGDTKRCFQPNVNNNINLQCDEAYVVNPDNVFSLLEARQLKKASRFDSSYESNIYEEESSSSSSSYHEAVQISPQHVSLKLRISKFVLSFFLVIG